MIYTYNDTKITGWELVEGNPEKSLALSLKCNNRKMMTVKEDKNEYPMDNEDKLKITNRVNILYRKNTYIGFNKNDFSPSIYATDRKGSAGRYDILCIQTDISAGEKLINSVKYNFTIFKYQKDVKNKCLRFIIGIPVTSLEGKFTLYFKSYGEKIIIKKTWLLDKSKGKFSYYEHFTFITKNPAEGERGHIRTDDNRVDSEYPVRVFIPKMCASAVLIPDMGDDAFIVDTTEKFNELMHITEEKPNPYTIYPVLCNEDNADAITMNLATLRKYHYCKVCTIYDMDNSGEDVVGKERMYLDDMCFVPNGIDTDTLKEALDEFKHVTILLNDGKILIYK